MAYHPGPSSGSSSSSGFQYLNSPFGDTTFTKLFVGGLAWETQSETLRRYFKLFGEILEAVVIIDKNTGRSKGYGFGMANFSKPARNLFMEIQKINSNYYPETLHRLFVINAGSGFKVLWKVLRAFFEARTLAKIQVLGSNYRSKLLEVIDPSNLPSFMGGNCTCSEYGGCLSSDKGPWNDTKITELLQGIVDAEEDNRNRERSGVAAKEAVPSDIDTIQIKDVYDISPPEDTQLADAKVVNTPVLKKLQAFEAALKDANMQIQTLEAWIKDTKVVLRGLGEHMEELKVELIGKHN